jgi:hypothetical protein
MTCVHMCKCTLKKNPEIHFTYVGNKDTCCIVKTFCISVSFSTKCCLLHHHIVFSSDNMFIINHAQKFKYKPGQIKVKLRKSKRSSHCTAIHCLQTADGNINPNRYVSGCAIALCKSPSSHHEGSG